MNWYGCEGRECHLSQIPSCHMPGETEENHENSHQNNWSPRQDFNPGLPEFKAVLHPHTDVQPPLKDIDL